MSGEPIGTVERDPDGATRDIGRRRVVRSTAVGDLLAFAGTFGLVLLYALRGGSYDIVVFEEYGLVIWWLLAIGVALPVTFVALIPHNVVSSGVGTLLDVVDFAFPFRAALDAVSNALSGTGGGLLGECLHLLLLAVVFGALGRLALRRFDLA